jgi:hypothetical protein
MSNQMNDAPAGAEQEEVDELDKQVERRREIYRHSLFVKVSCHHIAVPSAWAGNGHQGAFIYSKNCTDEILIF